LQDTDQDHDGQPIIVFSVGAEGGRIILEGRKIGDVWQYRGRTAEHALKDLLSDEDRTFPKQAAPLWQDSWDKALQQIDRYPWPRLHPLAVHPDFVERIRTSLMSRLPASQRRAWTSWEEILTNGQL
jgi:hypothetical protein